MKCTGGEGHGFANWLGQLSEFAENATVKGLSQISNSLQVFCDLMKDCTEESIQWRLSLLGREFSSLFEKAQDVVGQCGQIVNGLQRLLEGQLLSSQAFFREAAGGRFLPELDQVDGGSFFAKSITFATDSSCAQEMKDTLVSMMKIVKPNSGATEEDKTAIEEKYCKHMVQLMCCKAMDAILKVPEAGSTADVKVCLATVEQAVGHMAQPLEAHAGTAWAPMAKSWVSKNISAAVFGSLHAKMTTTIAAAIDSQPEGIDVYTNTRNAQKLRGIAFVKATHEACVGCLEDMGSAVKSLENIWACGASIDICQQGQAATIKALASQLNKVKCYASTIHGLNLVLHRFVNKSKMEKTALVREFLGRFWNVVLNLAVKDASGFSMFFPFAFSARYRKSLERSQVNVQKSLLAWITEEASN
eukprot:s1427_g22.t1